MPVFEEVPPPEPNAADIAGGPVIHSAAWGNAEQTCVVLQVTLPGTGQGDQLYTLNATDPYGSSPALRAELDRMVDEGEIEITPYVPDPDAEPEPTPAEA